MSPEHDIPGVHIEEYPSGARPIRPAPTSVTAFIGTAVRGRVNEAVQVDSLKSFERVFGQGSGLHAALHLYFFNGGEVALVVRSRDGSLRAFLQAFRSLDDHRFNLLCIPPDSPADQFAFAQQACETHRAILLADPPGAWTNPAAALAGLPALGVQGPNVAVYYPGLAGRGGIAIGPAPAVAGLIARTDAALGVWKAPAGTEAVLYGSSGLEKQLPAAEIEQLNAAGINPLREIPGTGPVVWGARTLAESSSEWRYLPVRRTALFIESSIRASTRWVVFEPNDEPLWAQLRASVGDFLMDLFRQGAFQGRSPQEAFFVRCDRRTMTEADIAAKRTILQLGFAPLRPAEFIILRFEFMTA